MVETYLLSVLYVGNKSPCSVLCLSFLFTNCFAMWTYHTFMVKCFSLLDGFWVHLPSDSPLICADLFVFHLSDSEKLDGRDYILFMSVSSGTSARPCTEFCA